MTRQPRLLQKSRPDDGAPNGRSESGRRAPAPKMIQRRVTSSGMIWVDGHPYYASRLLAGQVLDVKIAGDTLKFTMVIPLEREYRLKRCRQTCDQSVRLRSMRTKRSD